MAEQIVGGRHIRDQHAFFDQAMGIVTYHRNDAFDLAVLSEHDTRLGAVKVDGAAFVARGQQDLEQGIQGLQVRHQLTVLLAQVGILIH